MPFLVFAPVDKLISKHMERKFVTYVTELVATGQTYFSSKIGSHFFFILISGFFILISGTIEHFTIDS
jgi:hypothetical protein